MCHMPWCKAAILRRVLTKRGQLHVKSLADVDQGTRERLNKYSIVKLNTTNLYRLKEFRYRSSIGLWDYCRTSWRVLLRSKIRNSRGWGVDFVHGTSNTKRRGCKVDCKQSIYIENVGTY